MARRALGDENPKVRTAAALALGELRASSAIPKLEEALSDKEVSVVLAAAHALLLLKDPSVYEVYYAISTGEPRVARAGVRRVGHPERSEKWPCSASRGESASSPSVASDSLRYKPS